MKSQVLTTFPRGAFQTLPSRLSAMSRMLQLPHFLLLLSVSSQILFVSAQDSTCPLDTSSPPFIQAREACTMNSATPIKPWCCTALNRALKDSQATRAILTGQLSLSEGSAATCLGQLAGNFTQPILDACYVSQESLVFPSCWQTTASLEDSVPRIFLVDMLENCDDFRTTQAYQDVNGSPEDESCSGCYGRLQTVAHSIDKTDACIAPALIYALSRYLQKDLWYSKKRDKLFEHNYPGILYNLTSCQLSYRVSKGALGHQCPFPPSWITLNQLKDDCAFEIAVPTAVTGTLPVPWVTSSPPTAAICAQCMGASVAALVDLARDGETFGESPLAELLRDCLSPGIATLSILAPVDGAVTLSSVVGKCSLLNVTGALAPGPARCSLNPNQLVVKFMVAKEMCDEGKLKATNATHAAGECAGCIAPMFSAVASSVSPSTNVFAPGMMQDCVSQALLVLKKAGPGYDWKGFSQCAVSMGASLASNAPTSRVAIPFTQQLGAFVAALAAA